MTQFTGNCLCGKISYTCDAEPALIVNCHCEACRKALGAVHGTTLFVPEDKVTIHGTPRSYVHSADSGSTMTKMFCDTCGSQVFSKNTNRTGFMGIRAGSVNDTRVIRPSANIYLDSMVPTTPLDPNLPTHRKMPG